MLLNILQGPGQSPPQRVIGPNISSAKAEKNLQSTMWDLVGFEQKRVKGCGCRCLHQPERKSAGTRISYHINGETPPKFCGNNQCFINENPILNVLEQLLNGCISGLSAGETQLPSTSAQLALQENPESLVTAPVIPLGYFPASEKVHFKASISSDSARGKSPKFHLISHTSLVSHDDGKCSQL